MNKILDNPVWNALISSNSHLAMGNDTVKFFPGDIGPFAGMERFNAESFQKLYDLVPANRVAAIVTPNHLEIPGYWRIIEAMNALQMIFTSTKQVPGNHAELIPLEKKHVPQMIALTKLTNPGPFLQRTIEFGNYKGIFASNQLIAMAGQRMQPQQYVEVSAVCTHPDHTGKGYGKLLINDQVDHIIAQKKIPFLHVKAGNEHAINLYKHLGFTVRSAMNICVIQKK